MCSVQVPRINMSNGPTHKELLIEAKRRQTADLHEAAAASQQLAKAIGAVIRANSVNTPGCPSVMDKITTIHDLDREIDRQLHRDIGHSVEELVHAREQLESRVRRTRRRFTSDDQSYVDLLQRRVELVDQNLRILEHTLRLVKENT